MTDLASRGAYYRTSQCALVLEDEPVGEDSRLPFESFQGEIEETYAVNQYREMGGDRMPQPSHIAYRGGNWSPFQLTLIFRAGGGRSRSNIRAGGVFDSGTPQQEATPADLDQLLVEMERKVRWCQALTFPLERQNNEAARDLTRAINAGSLDPSLISTEAVSRLRRNDPPIVLAVFGSWWVQRCYATNVAIKWQGPWHPDSVRPYGAEVGITLQPIKAVYPTWHTIRDQAGKGGFTQDNPFVNLSGTVQQQQLRDAVRRRNNAAALSANPGISAVAGGGT